MAPSVFCTSSKRVSRNPGGLAQGCPHRSTTRTAAIQQTTVPAKRTWYSSTTMNRARSLWGKWTLSWTLGSPSPSSSWPRTCPAKTPTHPSWSWGNLSTREQTEFVTDASCFSRVQNWYLGKAHEWRKGPMDDYNQEDFEQGSIHLLHEETFLLSLAVTDGASIYYFPSPRVLLNRWASDVYYNLCAKSFRLFMVSCAQFLYFRCERRTLRFGEDSTALISTQPPFLSTLLRRKMNSVWELPWRACNKYTISNPPFNYSTTP